MYHFFLVILHPISIKEDSDNQHFIKSSQIIIIMNYLNRIADELLSRKLRSSAAVLVEGPKWCGKTSTCAQLAKSVIYL